MIAHIGETPFEMKMQLCILPIQSFFWVHHLASCNENSLLNQGEGDHNAKLGITILGKTLDRLYLVTICFACEEFLCWI